MELNQPNQFCRLLPYHSDHGLIVQPVGIEPNLFKIENLVTRPISSLAALNTKVKTLKIFIQIHNVEHLETMYKPLVLVLRTGFEPVIFTVRE